MEDMYEFPTVLQVNWGSFVLDGGAMFGIVPRPLWSRLIPPDDDNGIRLAARSMVIEAGNKRVLVDCGMWPYFSPKQNNRIYKLQQPDLDASLQQQATLTPNDVTDIIATHLHFDHVGGFARREKETLVPRFPNARFHVQEAQLHWGLEGSVKDRGSYVSQLLDVIRSHPLLTVHEGPWRLDPRIHVEVAHGHSPFMQTVRVECQQGTVIHTADMVPTSAHVPLPYIMAYDNRPTVTAEEKRELYGRFRDAVYFFQHDPEHPFWTIEEGEKGWRRKAPYFWNGLTRSKSGA